MGLGCLDIQTQSSSCYLLPFLLLLPLQLLHASAFLNIVKVEVGLLLYLRHLRAQPLLQHHLLVGQPLRQVSPLEPVQVLPRQRESGKGKTVKERKASLHCLKWCPSFSLYLKACTKVINSGAHSSNRGAGQTLRLVEPQ